MNPVISGCGCQGIMTAQNAKSKFPKIQKPQPRRTLPNSQPLESQTDQHRELDRSNKTISRELGCGRGQRGYLAEQACSKASKRAQRSSNTLRVDSKVWTDVNLYLGIQWSSEQIAGKVAVSHESVYLHVYANKADGGD
jgi:IS30 family transposase